MERIRAYLLLRDSTGSWSISVHQTFEALRLEWTELGAGCATAVVHVGFSRPPTAAFDRVADAFPEKVLLTATARYSVPVGTYSALPIGAVEGIPVFVALSGWGYEEAPSDADSSRNIPASAYTSASEYMPSALEDAPAQPTTELPGSRTSLLTARQQEWMRNLANARPAISAGMNAVGVYDEASYQTRERLMQWPLRVEVAKFRLEFLLADSDRQNPIAVACAAPPWVLEQPLSSLDLTVRALHALSRNGVSLVKDLTEYSYDKLLRIPNFGLKSFRNVAERILEACEGPYESRPAGTDVDVGQEIPSKYAPERRNGGANSANDVTSHRFLTSTGVSDQENAIDHTYFLDILVESINALRPPRTEVMRRRIGLQGARSTLQEIANDLQVTRERIRQIETKAVLALSTLSLWRSLLIPKLAELLEERVSSPVK